MNEGITPITHKEGVRRMTNWLRNSMGCTVVMAELHTQNSETPDVIGWRKMANSILIEVKVSRADFFCDKKKSFRRHEETGMGDSRFFAVPRGMIQPHEVPDGWGLLEICEGRIREAK